MDIVQICMIGVLGTLLAIQFKSEKPEYGAYIGVALSLFIFANIIGRLQIITDTITTISEMINVKKAYLTTLFKMLGITYISEFASAICKDAGHQTIAVQIEVFGKLTILALSMPILKALLETVELFLS